MSRVQLGVAGVIAIVALRLGIGLHFFYEGADKLKNPKPFSAGFLGNAKGPFAGMYKNMIWDADGAARLDWETTAEYWKGYADRAAQHYKFDEKQTKQAEKTAEDYAGRLRNWIGDKADEIAEYEHQLERRDKNAQDASRHTLASLRAHDAKIEGDRKKLWGQIVPGIDALWRDLENDMNALSTPEQWKAHGRLPIGKIGRRFGDSETVDGFIPYFDFIVGICLVLGLFVRPAATLAGLFLLSVCVSQWPGSVGAAPIYYQGVEMLGLFVLAAIGAGNLAGLDFFITAWRAGCCSTKKAAK